VSHVLEGSLRRAGNRIRVTAQLIHAADGTHLSSKRYDRELTDIFAVQDEISADIARQLQFQLGVARHRVTNLPAYEAYLEGRFRWHKYAPAEFAKGLQCFERAVAIDCGYAAAHTGIAQCCLGLVTEGGAPALEFLPRAAAAAHRALELDAGDAEALATVGQISVMLDYDWAAAGQRFQRALDLNPSPYVRMAHAIWYLIPRGRTTEAVAEGGWVVAQDPLHLTGRQVHAAALMFAGDYDKAAEVSLRILEIDDSFPKAIQTLSLIRGYQERFDEGIALAERLAQIVGRSYASLYTLAQAHALAGHLGLARRLLRELENLPGSAQGCAARIGLLYGLLGEPDAAFEWLERAIQQHEPTVLWMRAQRRMDCLRPDPRFSTMIAKLNLSER
jgi:tetratricopeptide (TPR) repeat protein